jgi:citrate synthase
VEELLALRVLHDPAGLVVCLDREALLVPADRLGFLLKRGDDTGERACFVAELVGRLVILIGWHGRTIADFGAMKRGAGVTRIGQAYPDRVEVRGRDLTGDLMGRLSFTEYFHLLLTGEEPTEEQRYFLDLLLVAIAEHGMMPTNVAARMTLAADPGSLQGAVAAGILGAGPVVLGTSEECARLLASGREPLEIAREIHDAGGKVPGFGHPVHRPLDPRAERILELADARGVSGPHVALARQLRDAVAEAWGKPLTMNVSMPIAAVMLDLGFPSSAVKAVPILARTAGLLAHLAEEQERPLGILLAQAAEEAVDYER